MFFNCISISCYLEANFGVSLLGYFFAWTFCLFFRFLRLWLLAPVLLLALEDLWFELEPKVILALVVVLALMPAVTLVLSHNIGDDLAVPLWLERIYCALWSSPPSLWHTLPTFFPLFAIYLKVRFYFLRKLATRSSFFIMIIISLFSALILVGSTHRGEGLFACTQQSALQ